LDQNGKNGGGGGYSKGASPPPTRLGLFFFGWWGGGIIHSKGARTSAASAPIGPRARLYEPGGPRRRKQSRGPHRSRRQPTPLPGLRCGTRLARRASPSFLLLLLILIIYIVLQSCCAAHAPSKKHGMCPLTAEARTATRQLPSCWRGRSRPSRRHQSRTSLTQQSIFF
jgi:hypothetical protein